MEKFDLENFPTSKSARKMLSYVSDGFYDESYVGKWLFQVMGIEYDKALEIAENLPAQFFPETATWGLIYHEIKWGLPVRFNLSYEERRKLIYQKRDCRAPMTPYHMENYLANVTGFEVHIADCNDPGIYGMEFSHPNRFRVIFIGEGSVNTKTAKEVLKRLKQSHTTYIINDRISGIVDNRNLEQIVLKTIILKMGLSFWGCHLFDGSWSFDGSVNFDAKRRYDLRLGLKYYCGTVDEWAPIRPRLFDGSWVFDGSVRFNPDYRYFGVKYKNQVKNKINVGAGMNTRFGIKFWNVRCFDGSWIFDGSVKFDAQKDYVKAAVNLQFSSDSYTEEIGEATVEIRRNLWYFDGSVLMDGSRKMNAMRKKEEI